MIQIYFPTPEPGKGLISIAAAMRINGGKGASPGSGPERTKFDKLNEEAPKLFELTDADHADVLIYPHKSESGEAIDRLCDEARKRNVGCLFVSWGDADELVKVSYGTVYRHSLFSDRRKEYEQGMAAEVSDPEVELGRPNMLREKQDVPTVGFCGFVSNPLMRTIYKLSGRERKVEGLIMRARLLRGLSRTKNLRSNFITRQSYWAGTRGRFYNNIAAEFRPRLAFWDNVMSSDYTLCIRGAGNFSYRFYEVLAAARIPLFVNTRCVLPFDDEIDWRKHCVWVEENQIDSAGEILKEFHAKLSPRQFRELQLSNRRLWEEKLRPLAFNKTMIEREARRRRRD